MFIEVGFVNTSEGFCNDGETSKEPWFEGGVFSRASLSLVLVSHDDTFDSCGLVLLAHFRDTGVLLGELVLDVVHLVVLGVDAGEEEVV